MPEPRHANREPDESPDEVIGEASESADESGSLLNPDLPHWAQWAPSKKKLWLALGPIIAIPVVINPILWVGRVWLATNAPLILMILSNKAIYLAAGAAQVAAVVYFAVAIIRRVLFAPCYFFLGRWGSEKGLEWMAKNSPSSARILDRLRRWFPRFGPLLVMFYPAPIVRVLAGASNMRTWVFMVYEVIGATSIATGVFVLAREFPAQMDAILDFISKYTWQLTVASLGYVALFVAFSEWRNKGTRAEVKRDLKDLEETMEDSIEAEEKR